jgi:hypothetical protein
VKYEVGRPNHKLPLALETDMHHRLLRAQLDVITKTGHKPSLSYIINKILRDADLKAVVADFGNGK